MQIHTTRLPSLDALFQDKERQLKQLIGDLQIDDVRDQKEFEATVKRGLG
jgi:hypothetical protein